MDGIQAIYGAETVECAISCTPAGGTLPFIEHFSISLTNLYSGLFRIVDARISALLAGGQFYPAWKAGRVFIAAGETFSAAFYQSIPDLPAVTGDNIFTLSAQDTTPSPYNQPPYPPSGDTDSQICMVQGFAP